jgi:hypothetical protein
MNVSSIPQAIYATSSQVFGFPPFRQKKAKGWGTVEHFLSARSIVRLNAGGWEQEAESG